MPERRRAASRLRSNREMSSEAPGERSWCGSGSGLLGQNLTSGTFASKLGSCSCQVFTVPLAGLAERGRKRSRWRPPSLPQDSRTGQQHIVELCGREPAYGPTGCSGAGAQKSGMGMAASPCLSNNTWSPTLNAFCRYSTGVVLCDFVSVLDVSATCNLATIIAPVSREWCGHGDGGLRGTLISAVRRRQVRHPAAEVLRSESDSFGFPEVGGTSRFDCCRCLCSAGSHLATAAFSIVEAGREFATCSVVMNVILQSDCCSLNRDASFPLEHCSAGYRRYSKHHTAHTTNHTSYHSTTQQQHNTTHQNRTKSQRKIRLYRVRYET